LFFFFFLRVRIIIINVIIINVIIINAIIKIMMKTIN
jgi:hypothetical protein